MLKNFWIFGAFWNFGFLTRDVQPVCLPGMMLMILELVCVETGSHVAQASFALTVAEAGLNLTLCLLLQCCCSRCATPVVGSLNVEGLCFLDRCSLCLFLF